MPEALIITPVKNSPDTTLKTIRSVYETDGDYLYIIYNDFSTNETKLILEKNKSQYGYELIHLENLTSQPSPNYDLVLRHAQKKAIELRVPLIIVESDVIIKKETLKNLLVISDKNNFTGMVGAITVDQNGKYNFPYDYEINKSNTTELTSRSLSFCCTLLSFELISKLNFQNLPSKKDWFDIHISRQSRKLGFKNFLSKNNEVLHLPHSSRPWKQLKYKNPIKYYFYKYLKKRDRI